MKRVSEEWKSKILDGLVPAGVLLLVALVVRLLWYPVSHFTNSAGSLIYLLLLLSGSMILLEQSMLNRRAEYTRAMDGMVSGLLAWLVISSSTILGPSAMIGRNGLILLIMVAIITGILWRRVYPLGMRYFTIIFLVNWGTLLITQGFFEILKAYSVFKLIYYTLGGLAVLAALGCVLYIFFRSKSRFQRIKWSTYLWFFLLFFLIVLGLPVY